MLSCEANPLQGMRDMWTIDAEVASALQNPRSTESEAQAGNKCPVLHFGKIRINYDLGVVSGGFSKVYFGSYCGKKVAIKMLFVMELTPQSIRDFYKEAQVLMVLRGEQVIECKGVTVMPPAIAVIMEYCRLGSLYTFLYENSQVSLDRERVTSVDSIRSQVFEMRTTFSTNPNVQMPVEVTMMLDAAQAVAFIHSKGYLHCDMKSLNYLVTDVISIYFTSR